MMTLPPSWLDTNFLPLLFKQREIGSVDSQHLLKLLPPDNVRF